MINSGKCPGCQKVLNDYSMKIETVTGSVGIGGPQYKCIQFVCSSCQTVVGAQIDPVAIKTDIVDALFKKLRK